MKIGEYQLSVISGGRFHMDGGAIFGVVPKVLWQRYCQADEFNRVPLDTNCLLIQSKDRKILIDSGLGSKLNEKQRVQYGTEQQDSIDIHLSAVGIEVGEIDTIIFTHLHFDHIGGATKRAVNNSLELTFPNAEYVIQRVEWETAVSDRREYRGAYAKEELSALELSGRIRFIEGDEEIVPGISAQITAGHTLAHQSIHIGRGEQKAVYLGDLCPSSWHLPTQWCLAYDVHLLKTRREKYKLLSQIAENNWLAIFAHDPNIRASRITTDARRDFSCCESLTQL